MPPRKRRTPRPSKPSRWEGQYGADKELSCKLAKEINDVAFRLVDVVSNEGDWVATIKGVKDEHIPITEVGERIAQNLVRVASTRIFADPSQSILEIPVNSIDAMLPDRQSVGKFGMGFFSILHWIVGHPDRELKITSAFNLRRGYMCPYELVIFEMGQDLWASVHVMEVATHWKRGTKVQISARGNDKWTDEEVTAFKKQLDRLEYVQGVTIWGSVNGGKPGKINTYHGTKGPAIHVKISRDLIEIDDIGPGIQLGDVFGALLTPSLSTKGIRGTADRVGAKEETDSSLRNVKFDKVSRPGVAVVVNGIQVFRSPGRTVVAVVEMPSWTPLPIARDDIVIDRKVVRDRFVEEVKLLIDEALSIDSKPFNCTECKFFTNREELMLKHKEEHPKENAKAYTDDRLAYHTVKRALRQYAAETTQTSIRAALQKMFFDVDAENKERFVHIDDFEAVYEDLVDEPGKFIAADTSNPMEIEKTLESLLPKLDAHKEVFPGRTVVKCDIWGQVITTGGTYSYVFVDKEHFDGDRWIQQVQESMSIGVNLHTEGDAELKEFDEMMKTFEKEGHHTLFVYEDDADDKMKRAWKRHRAENHKRLRVIYDRLMFMRRHCQIENKPERFSKSFPKAVFEKPGYRDRVKMHIMDIMATYSLFGHEHWARMVDYFIADLASYVKGREYSCLFDEISVHGLMFDTTGLELIHAPRPTKADLEFEAKLAREEERALRSDDSYRIMYGSMLTTMILDAHRPKTGYNPTRLPQLAFYTEVHRFLRTAEVGSIRAKMALLVEVSILLKKMKNVPKIFSTPISLTADVKRMLIDALEIYERHDVNLSPFEFSDYSPHRHVLDSIEAKTFGMRFTSWIRDQLRPVDPPTQFAVPKVSPTFTANQLVHHLMSSDVTSPEALKKAARKSKKTKLQMVEMIVNEGNTRRFDIAVVQELAQNSIDAIREEGRCNDLQFEVGKAVVNKQLCGVLRVVDCVGMEWEHMLMAHVPFYSGKSASAMSTGEMGTGFFNVFRDTVLVEMVTARNKKQVMWHSVPVREGERVVDIQYDYKAGKTDRANGTVVTLYVPVDGEEGLAKFLHEFTTTIKEMLSGVNADLSQIKLKDGRYPNTNKAILNRAGMRTPPFASSGFKMSKDEKSFSRKHVQCAITDPGRLSIIYTNGVPFAAMTDFLGTLPGDVKHFGKFLGTGWAMNLRKGAYQATQAREKIRELDSDVLSEIYLSLLDMVYMGQFGHGYAYIPNAGGIGGLSQNVEEPRDMYEEGWEIKVVGEFKGVPPGAASLLSCDYGPEIVKDYRPFGTTRKDSGQKSLLQHISTIVRDLQTSDLVKGKLKVSLFSKDAWVNGKEDHVDLRNFVKARVKGSHYEKEVEASVVKWIQSKSPDRHAKALAESAKIASKRIPYPSDSAVQKAVETMIRTYIDFGVAAGVTNFKKNMVTKIVAADTRENPHFSQKMILIPVTVGGYVMKGIEELIRWAKKNKDRPVTRIDLEKNEAFYNLLCPGYGQTGSTIPHEVEHARSYTDHKSYGAHAEWFGAMHASAKAESLEYGDRVDIAYGYILDTLVDGKTFCQTLTERLAAISLTPADEKKLADFASQVRKSRTK